MEKVLFYRVWYFEDFKKGEKFYFENRNDAEIARFNAYKGYDYERLTKRNYFVPVSLVKSALIPEGEIEKIKIYQIKEYEEKSENV